MTTPVVSINDGPAITVAQLAANPLFIPAKVIELLTNQFLDDVLLRDAGAATGSIVAYNESTPLYLDSDLEDVAEFAEIPVGSGSVGVPRFAVGVKKGKGIRISKEMKDEDRLNDVNRQITQLVNTMIRARARLVRAAFMNPAIPTIPAGTAWDQPGGRPRRDYANAMEVINAAKPAASQGDDEFGFEADTTVVPSSLAPVLMDNDNFLSVYKDALSTEDIRYTGKLPRDIMGLLPLKSRFWAQDRVLVLERGTVGFRADARPTQATPLYPEGNGPNGGPTESWRSDATMKRIIGLDQPLAACWITGVKTP